MRTSKKTVAKSALLGLSLVVGIGSAEAQQATDSRTANQAYGTRLIQPDLSSKAAEAGPNRRLGQRVNSRVNSRIALRIERYTVATVKPTAAYSRGPDNPSKQATIKLQPTPNTDSNSNRQ